MENQRLFTRRQAAEILGVSAKFLEKLEQRNLLRVTRIGRAVRVPIEEVERLAREGTGRR